MTPALAAAADTVLEGWLKVALVALFVSGLAMVLWPGGQDRQGSPFGPVAVVLWSAATLLVAVLVLFVA